MWLWRSAAGDVVSRAHKRSHVEDAVARTAADHYAQDVLQSGWLLIIHAGVIVARTAAGDRAQ